MHVLYPYTFQPNLSERPWGADRLGRLFHKPVPSNRIIGESWEIYGENVIANGDLAGRTLNSVLAEYGAQIGVTHSGEFPLLAKFIDTGDWLSIQVHPDDQQAQRLENQPRGKTECWYILHAEPGAQLAFGTAHPMDADQFRAAVVAGKTEQMMGYVPIQTGDFLFVRAGTPHAIGPGILVYELQQSSDLTYRVYDWGRMGTDGQPRTLHLDKALEVMEYVPRPDAKTPYSVYTDPYGNEVAQLIRGAYFSLDRISLHEEETDFETQGTPHLITVIEGAISIGDVKLGLGESALIPAGLGAYELLVDQRGATGAATIMMGWSSP